MNKAATIESLVAPKNYFVSKENRDRILSFKVKEKFFYIILTDKVFFNKDATFKRSQSVTPDNAAING